jgi:hypothetical protein
VRGCALIQSILTPEKRLFELARVLVRLDQVADDPVRLVVEFLARSSAFTTEQEIRDSLSKLLGDIVHSIVLLTLEYNQSTAR